MESIFSLKAITSDLQYLKVYGYNWAWVPGLRKPLSEHLNGNCVSSFSPKLRKLSMIKLLRYVYAECVLFF